VKELLPESGKSCSRGWRSASPPTTRFIEESINEIRSQLILGRKRGADDPALLAEFSHDADQRGAVPTAIVATSPGCTPSGTR
jgi:hypothetical protein